MDVRPPPFWGTLVELRDSNSGFGGGVSCFKRTGEFCSPIAILTFPATIGTNPSLLLSLSRNTLLQSWVGYLVGLLLCGFLCFYEKWSFIHNFSRISLEKREKFCRNGLQGREGEEQETQMYEDKGVKERGERRVLLFH